MPINIDERIIKKMGVGLGLFFSLPNSKYKIPKLIREIPINAIRVIFQIKVGINHSYVVIEPF